MNRLRTVFLAAIGLLPANPGSAQVAHLILSASVTSHDTVQLEPIAILASPTLLDVPGGGEDSVSAQFRARAYSPRVSYWLYSGGRRVGRAIAIAPGEYGCTGLPGTAKPQVGLPLSWSGLAAGDSTLETNTVRRPLTGREASRLRALMLAEARTQAPTVSSDSLHSSESWAIDWPGGRSWLVASYLANDPVDSLEYAEFSGLVVMETGARAGAPPLVWSHRGSETSRQVRRALDVLDIDGDGVPELITSTTYYESSDFQIWQYQRSGWIELVKSTGSAGC